MNNQRVISLLDTTKTEIIGNNIIENWNGIYSQNSSNINISFNNISFQGWDGISAMQSVNLTIMDNKLINNTVGIINSNSKNIILEENFFLNNTITDFSEVGMSDVLSRLGFVWNFTGLGRSI